MVVKCKNCSSTNLKKMLDDLPFRGYRCRECGNRFALDLMKLEDRLEFFGEDVEEDAGKEPIRKLMQIGDITHLGVDITEDNTITVARSKFCTYEELKEMDMKEIKERLRAIGYLIREEKIDKEKE